jgi:hypothetical protein
MPIAPVRVLPLNNRDKPRLLLIFVSLIAEAESEYDRKAAPNRVAERIKMHLAQNRLKDRRLFGLGPRFVICHHFGPIRTGRLPRKALST